MTLPRVGRGLLAIDTATSTAVVAIGSVDGDLEAEDAWPAGYRHGEDLLTRVRDLLSARSVGIDELSGIVVGTGPGAFTGLRVGIATAKGIAHALSLPIAGVSSGEALILAATRDRPDVAPVLLLPAGPNDTVLVRHDQPPKRLIGGPSPTLSEGEELVAVDLDGRAPLDAIARGESARRRFAAALVRLGADRLADGGDDLARLVPEYVTLPRGVAAQTGEVAWSRDPR